MDNKSWIYKSRRAALCDSGGAAAVRPVSLPAPPGSTMATGYIDARLQHLRADERHMRRRSARGAPLLFRALLGLITTVMLLLLWMRQPLVSTSSAAVRERVPAKPHKAMPDAITPQDDALGLLSSHATSEASPPLSPEPAAAPLPSSREQPQRRGVATTQRLAHPTLRRATAVAGTTGTAAATALRVAAPLPRASHAAAPTRASAATT